MRGSGQVWAAAIAATTLLSGCATGQASAPPSAAPTDEWGAARIAFEAEYGILPDRGPELSDTDAAAALVADADRAWSLVLQTYPDAVRPTEGFVRWAVEGDRSSPTGADLRQTSPVAACVVEHGGVLDLGQGSDGSTYLGTSSSNAGHAVASYFCLWVAYPERPFPPSPERAGYIWDYYTKFLVPCFEDHGVVQEREAIDRAQYVSEFPRQTWAPTFPETPIAECSPELPGSDLG